MREVTVELLRQELFRASALLTQTKVLHSCGMRLHASADTLTALHLKAMTESQIRSVFLLEPGESEATCARTLAIEMVEPGAVVEGDIVMQELRAPDGTVWVPGTTKVDAEWLRRVMAHTALVPIRKRKLDADAALARQYLAKAPMQPPKGPRPDTRVTQITAARAVLVKQLLVPKARIFVSLADEFARSLVAQTLKAEGHEALEFPDLQGLLDALGQRPDVVILDLADAKAGCDALRKAPLTRGAGVLVTSAEGQAKDVYKALQAGANGSLSLPARRDVVLEAVNGVLRVMGKYARIKPALRGERRRAARESVQFACRLFDGFLTKPLPVQTVTVEDVHERGLRVVYQRPTWPEPWAYMAGSVHPKHFFYNYAKVNPLSREVSLAFVSPAGAAMQVSGTFVHVALDGVYEAAGLALSGGKSVKQHMTSMRISSHF